MISLQKDSVRSSPHLRVNGPKPPSQQSEKFDSQNTNLKGLIKLFWRVNTETCIGCPSMTHGTEDLKTPTQSNKNNNKTKPKQK